MENTLKVISSLGVDEYNPETLIFEKIITLFIFLNSHAQYKRSCDNLFDINIILLLEDEYETISRLFLSYRRKYDQLPN